jgi:RES domain-containing protein
MNFPIKPISHQKIKKTTLSVVRGTYYRIVSQKYKDQILSTEGSLKYGGRYNPARHFGVLYLSESKEVCLAERSQKTAANLLEFQVIGKIKVTCTDVLDLTNTKNLKTLGLTAADLTLPGNTAGWKLPQQISYVARQTKIKGLLVPSAATKGKNLVIFDKAIESAEIKVISVEETE